VHVIDEWSKIMPTTNWLTAISIHPDPVVWREKCHGRTLSMAPSVAFNAYVLMLAEPAQQLTGSSRRWRSPRRARKTRL